MKPTTATIIVTTAVASESHAAPLLRIHAVCHREPGDASERIASARVHRRRGKEQTGTGRIPNKE